MYDMTNEIDGNSARFNVDKIVYSNLPPVLVSRLFSNDLAFIPYRPLNKLAEHYTLANAKYPNAESGNGHSFPNWAKGQLFESFVIDSMYRHLMAYNAGEINDPDFGTHHLISVAWGAAALYHFFFYYPKYEKFDDRKWVGFELEERNDISKSITSLLTVVQTSQTITKILDALFAIFVNALKDAEEDFDKSQPISYKVDAERLANIRKNMNESTYGDKKTATRTKGGR